MNIKVFFLSHHSALRDGNQHVLALTAHMPTLQAALDVPAAVKEGRGKEDKQDVISYLLVSLSSVLVSSQPFMPLGSRVVFIAR